jgi:hypothetical protein
MLERLIFLRWKADIVDSGWLNTRTARATA